jgi:hypothetical protein
MLCRLLVIDSLSNTGTEVQGKVQTHLFGFSGKRNIKVSFVKGNKEINDNQDEYLSVLRRHVALVQHHRIVAATASSQKCSGYVLVFLARIGKLG